MKQDKFTDKKKNLQTKSASNKIQICVSSSRFLIMWFVTRNVAITAANIYTYIVSIKKKKKKKKEDRFMKSGFFLNEFSRVYLRFAH